MNESNTSADFDPYDLMTELLPAELEDETGTTRRLTREELLTLPVFMQQ